MKRNLHCPNCKAITPWEGSAETKWVRRILCECGTILTVETDKECETGILQETQEESCVQMP